MTFDRAQVIEDYIQQLIESMDYKTMEYFVYDTLMENLTDYSDEQLIAEVTEYDPELLKDVTV
jgi:heme oxygenase